MKRLLSASAVAALLIAGPAMAGNGHGHDKGKAKHSGHDRPVATMHRDHRDRDWKAEGRHDNGLHLGQRKQAWARGQRLPQTYLAPRYYVRNYDAYDLYAPPSGTVWVRPYEDSREFYLVQVATGIISQIFGR